METTLKIKNILSQINNKNTKLGDVRKLAKEIKKDGRFNKQMRQPQKTLA